MIGAFGGVEKVVPTHPFGVFYTRNSPGGAIISADGATSATACYFLPLTYKLHIRKNGGKPHLRAVFFREEQTALAETEETEAAEVEKQKEEKKKPGIMSKVWKAVLTAITSTLATILGTYVSDKITGKKTKSRTSATGRVVKNATSAATRSVTRELTRDILGNLIK